MRHASNAQTRAQQAEVKVAVISAQAASEDAQRQTLQENIALALLGLSALALWIA